MAALNVQKAVQAGLEPTYVAPTATTGDTFKGNGGQIIHVKNGSASPITVTVKSPGTCSYGVSNNSAHDLQVSVPASKERMIKVADKARFVDADGNVTFICSAVATVTVAVVE